MNKIKEFKIGQIWYNSFNQYSYKVVGLEKDTIDVKMIEDEQKVFVCYKTVMLNNCTCIKDVQRPIVYTKENNLLNMVL